MRTTAQDPDLAKAAKKFMDWFVFIILASMFLFGAGVGFVFGIIATLAVQYMAQQ